MTMVDGKEYKGVKAKLGSLLKTLAEQNAEMAARQAAQS